MKQRRSKEEDQKTVGGKEARQSREAQRVAKIEVGQRRELWFWGEKDRRKERREELGSWSFCYVLIFCCV